MRDKTFHIVTTGGYGYNDVGDEAMPRTLLINLKSRFKDNIRFTMLSPQPAFTEQYHGEKASQDILFSGQTAEAMNAERAIILDLARRYHSHPGWTRLLISKGLGQVHKKWYSQFLALFALLKSSDALLNVGGGNLNSIMQNELYKKTTLYEICKIFNKDVFVSGQSIGPFYNDNDKAIARESLSKVDVLTFRDKGFSFNKVQRIGLVDANYNKLPLMYDAGDDAMSMPQLPKVQALALIEKDTAREWKNYDARQIWALNLKASLNSFKGKGRLQGLGAEVKLLAAIAEYILKNFSSKILLVPTDYCQGVDDRVYHKQILNKISPEFRQRVFSLENVYTDFELKGILSTCDFALGSRYHFHVFSLAAKVPSIGIASGEYQQAKLKGVYSLLDLQAYYIDKDMEYATLFDVTAVINRLVKERDRVVDKLDRNVGPLVDRSKKIVDIVYDKFTTGIIDGQWICCRATTARGSQKHPANAEKAEKPPGMHNRKPIIASVIIPTLNHSRSLQIALKSIIDQDFPPKDYEILVVDNGSGDDTRVVAESAMSAHPNHNIRYILEPIPGLLSGRHRGASEAQGHLLLFVDDDIEAAAGWLSSITGTFQDPTIHLVGGPSLPRFEIEPPEWMGRHFHKKDGQMTCGSLSLLNAGNKTIRIDPTYIWGLNFSIRKATLFELGGFHPDGVPKNMLCLRGDGETGLSLKLRNRSLGSVYTPQALVYHHIARERLTVRYFEERNYAQGISDSYTRIRQNGGVDDIKLPLQPREAVLPGQLPAYQGYSAMVNHRIQKAYVDGFIYHYNKVKTNHALLQWVLRENYFDYSHPDLEAVAAVNDDKKKEPVEACQNFRSKNNDALRSVCEHA